MIKTLEITTTSKNQIEYLVSLINKVYAITESDFWNTEGDYSRTDYTEISNLISKGEISVFMDNEKIVGSIHHYPDENKLSKFGMLVCDPNVRGKGIGGKLITQAEEWSRNKGYSMIGLEILKPKFIIHRDKETLHKWYTKLGYRITYKCGYEDLYPHKAHHLLLPCDFIVYHKSLV